MEEFIIRKDGRQTDRNYRLCAKIGMTQAQTARAMNVTREAVRQYAKRWGIEFRSGKPWNKGAKVHLDNRDSEAIGK